MPVEIRELVIRATVGAPRAAEAPGTDAHEQELEEIVTMCVEQVLEILRREKER
ncbi:MAG: hypothetical protein HYY76_02585 [Acidobacteria bacterium]|nr:hypothetical protein [Acidobacteriota bacterium]